MREDKSRKQRKRQVHELSDLEVPVICLVDKPAIDIEFLVLKRHAPTEEVTVPKKAKKAKEGEEREEGAEEEPAAETEEEATEEPETGAETEPEDVMASLKSALEKVAEGELPDDIRVAAQVLMEYVERAEKADAEAAEVSLGPTDFDEAWAEREMEDTLWKALYIFNRVVSAIYDTPEVSDKAKALGKAITDFAAKVKEMMGTTKTEGSEEETPAGADGDTATEEETTEEETTEEETTEETPSDESDAQILAKAMTDLSAAFGEEMADVKAKIGDIEKHIAGKAPEQEASTEGDAAEEESEKPATLADVQKAVADAIAKAKQPQYKGVLPKDESEEESTEEETTPRVRTAKERQKTLRELNERFFKGR